MNLRQSCIVAMTIGIISMMFGMWTGVQIGISLSSGPGGAQVVCAQLGWKIITCEMGVP